MRKKFLQLILLVVSLCQTAVFAQNSTITGKVLGSDNAPVPGASITVSGTSQGTVTDADGNFSINAPANSSLLINSIGFADQVVKVAGRSVVNVTLASGQSAGLDEVVVTGYTSQKKKDIIGSVSVVDVKALKAVPSGSAMEALQGQAAGVNVINSGSPGSGSSLLIRGVTGFGGNNPLVLVDGVEGDINLVPTNDVESIQVLKDAGAASVYGSRAANGVIIVTTKKGKSGAPKITYDSYYDMQIPYSGKKLNVLNAQEYATLWAQVNPSTTLFPGGVLPDYIFKKPQSQGSVQGIGNEGNPDVDPSKYFFDDNIYTNNYIISKVNKNGHTDQYDAVYNPALMMNHNVTASGGTDRSNYLLSFGFLDQNGMLLNTYLKRYSVRVNTTFKLRDNIRLGENLYVYYQDNPQVPTNGAFGPNQAVYEQLPFIPIYDIGGHYAGFNQGPVNELGGWSNAKADQDMTGNNRSREFGINGNAFLEIDIIKHLTARTSFGGSVRNFYYQNYSYPAYWNGATSATNNSLTEYSGFQSTAQWTNTLHYENDFGKSHLSVLAGVESIERKGRTLSGRGQGFIINDYNYGVLGNANVGVFPNYPGTPYIQNDALFSYIGKIDYSFNDRYLVSLTVRRDGFSRFGANEKYGNFPAVAAGWRVSQEEFMKNVTWVNDLKIRGSYGEMGNSGNISPYNSYTTYRTSAGNGNYDINGTNTSPLATGFYPATLGNSNTKWETNKLFNIGFDATLFNNRFDVSVDYYTKSTDGLLFVLPVPGTVGEATPPSVNFGDVGNKGVDINANYHGRLSKDVTFNVGVNFTTYNNKVKRIPAPGYGDEGRIRFEEGYPIGSFYGYKITGIFQDSSEILKSPLQQQAAPGRYKYQDTDGNDTINDLDRTHFGKSDPDYTIGINLGLTVKKFDFSAQIYTSQGNSLYNGILEYLGSFERGISNKSRRVLDAWTPDHTNTMIKKNELGVNFSNSGVNNNDFLENGSFVRLRSIQAGYTLSSGRLKTWGLQSLRLYVQGTNLITLTKYSGLDPEIAATGRDAATGTQNYGVISSRGNDAGAYVVGRGVVVGLNVTF